MVHSAVILLLFTTVCFAQIPLPLDTSAPVLFDASHDYGNVTHKLPLGVVSIESVDDVVDMVQYAACELIPIVPMGQRHSVMAQAQVESGIVLNMTLLNDIDVDVASKSVWVQTGATWKQLLTETLLYGLTPPVFTDYIDLSIGGTISVGGIGSQSFRVGLQVDNVEAIQIVTGKGKVEVVSKNHKRKLFDAAVAGYGQFGVITAVKIPLVDAYDNTLTVQILYNDLNDFLDDLYTLINDPSRFDGVQGFVRDNTASANTAFTGVTFPVAVGDDDDDESELSNYVYMIEGSVYYNDVYPDVSTILQGLEYIPGGVVEIPSTYFGFVDRLFPTVNFLKQIGIWQLPHPKASVFIARDGASAFIRNELSITTAAEVGGPIFVYPFFSSNVDTVNFPLPDAEEVMLFGFSRTCSPADVDFFVNRNYEFYGRALLNGGTGYAIDAIPLNPASWAVHFGSRYSTLENLKGKYDPTHILTPSQYVFEGPSRNHGRCSFSTTSESVSTPEEHDDDD